MSHCDGTVCKKDSEYMGSWLWVSGDHGGSSRSGLVAGDIDPLPTLNIESAVCQVINTLLRVTLILTVNPVYLLQQGFQKHQNIPVTLGIISDISIPFIPYIM